MAFFPERSEYYDDYCTGARMKRIHEALPAGTAALTGVFFFDEINQDKKGFATSEGCIIVGGFFRREVRESMYAKKSIATFPSVQFPKVRRPLHIIPTELGPLLTIEPSYRIVATT
jgi:hypothetical protein